ncbi:MAG TPA: sugar transferase [Kineosporiaceae bacterium]|nr:sugar transferase [Kineosporiaceae bacterium]
MTLLPLRVSTRRAVRPPGTKAAVKRSIDVVLAGSALVVLAPVLLAIVVIVRCTSRGPALFRQERLGLDAQPFTVLKFRTMRVDCDDGVHRDYVTRLLTAQSPPVGGESGLYKLDCDPRITPVGHWLRRTSLDELPQLVNVVRGEMSLVGPRPPLAWEATLYSKDERRRFEVLPGITGLWQVSGRSRLSMREALALDVEYVRRQSLWLDLLILARTVPAVLRREAT